MRDPLAVFQLLVPNLSGKLATTHGGEYAGKCPFTERGECSSREDAFRCWPYRMDRPTLWFCRKCRRSGDLIELARGVLNPGRYTGYHEACDWLEISESERRAPLTFKPLTNRVATTVAPPLAWQEKAAVVIQEAIEALWNTEYGGFALEYLRGRGLSDSVLRYARIGVLPEDSYELVREWGLQEDKGRTDQKLKIPAGIVFPCLYNNECEILSLVVRRSDEDAELDPTGNTDPYWMVKGSGEGLYMAHTVQVDVPTIMVESYIDALTILSVCQGDPDLREYPLGVCATRSTTGARRVKWTRKLALSSGVLQAYDADAGGDAGAAYWMGVLAGSNCLRWSPNTLGTKDVNEAAQIDPDMVAEWIKAGLRQLLHDDALFRTPEPAVTHEDAPVDRQDDQQTVCPAESYMCSFPDCRSLLNAYVRDGDGKHWCIDHVWESPSLQSTIRQYVRHDNEITAQICTFLLSLLTSESMLEQGLVTCYRCDDCAAYMDMYGRLWCSQHRFPGCAVIRSMPQCIEEFGDEAFFESNDYEHCHLCGVASDTLTVDTHDQVWCVRHAPYAAYELSQFFPWLFEQARKIGDERMMQDLTLEQCVYNECCYEGTHKDVLDQSWCDTHGFSCDLVNEGNELTWQRLYVPPGEAYGGTVEGDLIEGGRQCWIAYAKSASRQQILLAHRFAWNVIRGEQKNEPGVRYPCVRRDTSGCKNPTNTQLSVQDIYGRSWCQECRFAAALLEEAEGQGYPSVHGEYRWEKGEMFVLQGEEEYIRWALYQPMYVVKKTLYWLREFARQKQPV